MGFSRNSQTHNTKVNLTHHTFHFLSLKKNKRLLLDYKYCDKKKVVPKTTSDMTKIELKHQHKCRIKQLSHCMHAVSSCRLRLSSSVFFPSLWDRRRNSTRHKFVGTRNVFQKQKSKKGEYNMCQHRDGDSPRGWKKKTKKTREPRLGRACFILYTTNNRACFVFVGSERRLPHF